MDNSLIQEVLGHIADAMWRRAETTALAHGASPWTAASLGRAAEQRLWARAARYVC